MKQHRIKNMIDIDTDISCMICKFCSLRLNAALNQISI